MGLVWLVGVVLGLGCEQGGAGRWPWEMEEQFPVREVRLNRSFTRVVAGGPGEAAGIEACVQLMDQFGDVTKATGEFRFELYRHRAGFADPRGQRFEGGVEVVDLRDVQVNQEHWDPITRCYVALLAMPPGAELLDRLVLQVTYLAGSEYRLQDRVELEVP